MSILLPAWPEIPGIVALTTTRRGGASVTPYAGFNLASGVGDKERNVMANRDNLNTGLGLGRDPCWLKQLHATTVVDVPTTVGAPADGAVTSQAGVVCAILTADCVPILLAQRDGKRVAALHAGWRGLAAGVVESGVAAMGCAAAEIVAWLGPSICATHYVVGDEVRSAFQQRYGDLDSGFTACNGSWRADLRQLAHEIFNRIGVAQVYADTRCTHGDEELLFSYRRDGVTGRMASLIWITPGDT